MLNQDKNARILKIKENGAAGVYVENLSSVKVTQEEQIIQILKIGEKNRKVGWTQSNQRSSRSHSIFTIEVVQKFPDEVTKRGVINLVDLAGSERVSKSFASGEALEEAKKIN